MVNDMKEFRVIATNKNGIKLEGVWYNANEWTIEDVLDFIVPAMSNYVWQVEYR